jgi:hypothetical protein
MVCPGSMTASFSFASETSQFWSAAMSPLESPDMSAHSKAAATQMTRQYWAFDISSSFVIHASSLR